MLKSIWKSPIKKAIASLVIGFFLLFPALTGFGRILLLFAGIGIIYGATNLIKGNEATKKSAKITLKKIGLGTMSGSMTGFLLIIISQYFGIGKHWSIWLLAIAIPGALIIGLFAGGIGGLILGSRWKHPKSAIIGGVVAITILSPGIFLLFSSCTLLGGC